MNPIAETLATVKLGQPVQLAAPRAGETMKPLPAFYTAALLGLGLGWFGLGMVEYGAILLGAVIVLFAAVRADDAEAAHRSSTWWVGAFVLGASIAVAGAFDLFNAGLDTELGDWNTGFIVGLVLVGSIALLHVSNRWRRRKAAGRDCNEVATADASDRDSTGLVALVLGVLVMEAIARFLAEERSTAGQVADAVPALAVGVGAAAVGFGASISAQFRVGKAPVGARLLGDLGAAALIASGFALPGKLSLVSIALFGLAWGIAMLGVAYSRPAETQVAAAGVFTRGALTGMVNAVLFIVLTIGALAPRFNSSVADAVAALEDVVPLPQSVFARLMMNDSYLWADAWLFDGSGSDRRPQDVIEARRHPHDRWSGALPATLSNAIFRGETSEGVDFVDEGGATIVGQVHPESPAAAAGVKRGWRLAKTGGHAAANLTSFTDPDGARHEVDLRGSGATVPAAWWSVVEHGGHKVGYLHLSSFLGSSRGLLESSFAALKREGVEDLVLDLRYNQGGSLGVAQRLASLIAGPALEGAVFQRLFHNGKYRDQDRTARILNLDNALGLKRVFVLTTKSTCSASEAVINGLAPHIKVVTIGDKTCGKPVGFAAVDYRGVSYWVIDFRVRNAADRGDYFNGLAPTCSVEENLRQTLGASDEALFAAALRYMSTGRCGKHNDAINGDQPQIGTIKGPGSDYDKSSSAL